MTAELLEQIQDLHRSAQAQLGLTARALARDGAGGVDVLSGSGVEGWADTSAAQVMELRELSGELAATSYQLGRVVSGQPSLGTPAGGATTARDLLGVFLDQVETVGTLGQSRSDIGAELRRALGNGAGNLLAYPDLLEARGRLRGEVAPARFAVDPFTWPTFDQSTYRQYSAYQRALIRKRAGRANTLLDLAGMEERKLAQQVRVRLVDVVSAAADRATLGAGRDMGMYAAGQDKRLLVWARGTSSSPCAFCAMLAANGFYKPNQSARNWVSDQSSNEGVQAFDDLLAYVRSYHLNCRCYPIFRWVGEVEDLPKRNEFYRDMWHEATSQVGLGNSKVSASTLARRAYRRWLEAHLKANGGAVNTQDTRLYESPGGKK